MAKRVTIKGVAAQTDSSYQTVSRVINNEDEVSSKVCARSIDRDLCRRVEAA